MFSGIACVGLNDFLGGGTVLIQALFYCSFFFFDEQHLSKYDLFFFVLSSCRSRSSQRNCRWNDHTKKSDGV